MKKAIITLLLLCLIIETSIAQKTLTKSRQSSYYTYIYKLNTADVLRFYKYPDKQPDEKILKNPVDSFKTHSYWENKLPAGNYLQVFAEYNKLNYSIIENHSVFIKLFENNYDHRFVFVDKEGSIINPTVNLNGKTIPYDPTSSTYHFKSNKKSNTVQADYNGVSNFFYIRQQGYDDEDNNVSWFKSLWVSVKKIFHHDHYGYRQKENPYMGFVVFNKPKYKPLDTVRFKAFILNSKSKNPVTQKKLYVKLQSNYGNDSKLIGTVSSYRNGGFEYSFVLNDSLKLTLDRNYSVSLVDPEKTVKVASNSDNNGVMINGSFEYEDYELKSIHFTLRKDREEHWKGNPLSIYLKATDDNDLPLPDGRVTLTLTSNTASNYTANYTFVKDTLWVHQVVLEPAGETKIVIPDSIFPKANVQYTISADLLNSSNEHCSTSTNASFKYERFHLITGLDDDTLKVSYQDAGKDIIAKASICSLDVNDDTIKKTNVTLPAKLIIDPNADSYTIETDSLDTDLQLKDYNSGVALSADRSADSLFVKVDNPRKLKLWYSVFAGNKLIDAGQLKNLFYKKAFTDAKIVTFLVNYIWGGESKTEKTGVVYRADKLSINVKQPVSVYPGQQVQTEIVVTNAEGKPVANTDLTAWALTGKFENYSIPYVRYLGRNYKYLAIKKPFEIKDADISGWIKLNWERWSKEMGLDSIAYYQFTHPKTIYRSEESITDTLTQIAPFIVKRGDIEPVHLLFIDEKPVYFSQAQQLQRYSFAVTPGKHSLRFRTADQIIKLDNVNVERYKKLIISINADSLNKAVSFTKMPDTLTNYEAQLLDQYMITLVNNFDWNMALLDHDGHIDMLNPQPGDDHNRTILAGPVGGNYVTLNVGNEQDKVFIPERDYSYQFEPVLVKQKSIPTKYPFNKYLNTAKGSDDYTQYVLTRRQADSIWQELLFKRSNTQQLFNNAPVGDQKTGKLTIEPINARRNKFTEIKSIVLSRYNDPDFIGIYPGNTSDMYRLKYGRYRLLFLLKDGSYDIKDNINVKAYGINYYKLSIAPSHPKDSISNKINNIIDSRPGRYKNTDYDIENDALKLKELFNQKYLDTSKFVDVVKGKIVDKTNQAPLFGVSIRIKGTSTGTISNRDGYFSIKVPPSGKLIISYIGYITQEIAYTPGKSLEILLDEQKQMLQEVVVIGYGTTRRQDLTGSVSTVSRSLMGRAAGISMIEQDSTPGGGTEIRIRGVSTLTGQKPLYIVNGLIVESMAGLDPATISEISILKSTTATALYGARAANGVVLITTTNKKLQNNASANTISTNNEQTLRKNFADYAYWQPKMTTDAQGRASFTTTFPDDITNWRTFIIGINDKHQSGSTENQIKSYKVISASFISPQFAVKGDQISAIGKLQNYTNDTVDLHRSFTYNGKLIKNDALKLKNSIIDTLNVAADGTDSLTFEYALKQNNGYFDDERRKIPLVEKGVMEIKGVFASLSRDTSLSLKFNSTVGPVTFRAEASLLPVLLNETEKLKNYQYLCNEQLASKLIGLLAEKKIRAFLHELFKGDKNIKQLVNKLQENRRNEGSWGWWKDTEEELWISLHATEALIEAEKQGFNTTLDKQKLTNYLIYQLDSYKGEDKLTCLQLLKSIDARVDYQRYTGIVSKEIRQLKYPSMYDQLRLLLLKQQLGMPVKTDSLYSAQHHTLLGNIYWGEDSYRFFNNSIELSVLAYKIIKNEGKHPDMLGKIQGYFLEQRRDDGWRNTYQTSLILETILPDLLVDNKKYEKPVITLSGDRNETIDKFPYMVTMPCSNLTIKKSGSLPVYITGYQQFWNYNPEKVNKEFTVNTWFEKKGSKLTKLKGGETTEQKVEVITKGDGDYIMINVPIPAGCSYENKDQPWQNEVHREYFKDRVSIFCRKLKQGTYVFTVNLMPRYDGYYTLNPAKAEMMYFPVFYGREGLKKVVIGN